MTIRQLNNCGIKESFGLLCVFLVEMLKTPQRAFKDRWCVALNDRLAMLGFNQVSLNESQRRMATPKMISFYVYKAKP